MDEEKVKKNILEINILFDNIGLKGKMKELNSNIYNYLIRRRNEIAKRQ